MRFRPFVEQLDLLAELLHHLVALGRVVLQRRRAGQLHDRRRARQRRVDHLADRVGDLGASDREAEPPAAHAVRLAEGVGGDALLDHAGLAQERVVPAPPDHVAIRLVAEDGDVLAADEVGDALQVVLRRHAAGRVVRRVEEDRPRRRVVLEELLDVGDRRAGSRSPACSGVSTARAPRRSMFGMYVGKCGLKTSTPSPGSRNASQKNCSNTFAPGPTTTFSASAGMSNSVAHELGGRRAELGKARRRAVVRLVVLDGLDAAGARRGRAVERAVADLQLDDVLACGLQRSGDGQHGEGRFDGERAGETG